MRTLLSGARVHFTSPLQGSPPQAQIEDLMSGSPLRVVPDVPLSLLDPEVTREEVLERIDPDTLRTAPLNLLVSTALALAPQDAGAATEDMVLRYSTELSGDRAVDAFIRTTAEKLVLADVEYQQSIVAYTEAEQSRPVREDWRNPQHYLEALKVHERRMDRLLRARKETFERYDRAAACYRAALTSSKGLQFFRARGPAAHAVETPEVLDEQGQPLLTAGAQQAGEGMRGPSVMVLVR